MSRKKKHAEHVNHERWLVSYADFITLLFAFFVVMFAVSQVDSRRMGRFTEAFSRAVGINLLPQGSDGLMPTSGGVRPPQAHPDGDEEGGIPAELASLRSALLDVAARDSALQGLQIIQRRHEIVLRLPEGVLFESGDARMRENAASSVASIVEQIRSRNVNVRVEGHTDDRPIRTARFRSNWELSTARATSVLATIAGTGRLEAPRLSAAGYGEFHPVAPNATEEGRRQNRRVDLVVTMIAPPAEPAEGPEASPE